MSESASACLEDVEICVATNSDIAAASPGDKEVEKLQKQCEDLENEKVTKTNQVKDSGPGLMQAILASKGGKSEL